MIRVDTEERKIGLSFVHADFEENKAILEEAERKAKQKAAKPAAAAEGEAPMVEVEPVEEPGA